ncbi:hypothetical protein ABZ841_21320, partial [Streptomyces flaveolus]
MALVTRASSGIGAAVARRPAADGVRVAGEALAAELPDAHRLRSNVAGPGARGPPPRGRRTAPRARPARTPPKAPSAPRSPGPHGR